MIRNWHFAATLFGRFALAALLGSALLAGCTRESTPDLIRSAREYQAKGEHQSAIIQLKNALQKQPDSAEARFLLGQSSLIIVTPPRRKRNSAGPRSSGIRRRSSFR